MKTIKYGNFLALLALLLTSCNDANYKPTEVDRNFGLAYKQVTQAQILNPDAAQNPPARPSKQMNGEAGENTLRTYREGFSTIEESQPVEISIGGSSGSSN